MSFDWKSLVQSVAPTIATALGGPFAGMGVKALSTAILGNENGNEEEISVALMGAGPETIASMKKAELEFKATMKSLDIKLEELVFKDKASARERQTAIKDRVPEYLAYMLTLGFFGIIAGLFYHAIPEPNKNVIHILVGSLGTAWVSAMAFFHGSSRSSARKDMLISNNKG